MTSVKKVTRRRGVSRCDGEGKGALRTSEIAAGNEASLRTKAKAKTVISKGERKQQQKIRVKGGRYRQR